MTIVLKKTKITKEENPHEILITNLSNGDILIMVGWAVDVYNERSKDERRSNERICY